MSLRLIDAEKLDKDVLRYASRKHAQGKIEEACDILKVRQVIGAAPTIDAKPVRHGRWVPYYEPMECFVDVYLNTEIKDVQVGWICSECGRHEQHSTVEEMPYCHCGAKMDAEVNYENEIP